MTTQVPLISEVGGSQPTHDARSGDMVVLVKGWSGGQGAMLGVTWGPPGR